MDDAGKRTNVLLVPHDLIHREILEPDDENIGFVRDLLIDEVDWKCASCTPRKEDSRASANATS